MLSEPKLHALLNYTATHPVLSVYLNTDPSLGNASAHQLQLRSMLKGLPLQLDVEAVLGFFSQEYDWASRSVAVFSCVPEKYFQAIPLAIPVRNLVHVGNRPSIRRLADLLDNYGGYGVVLVDKQGVRLFSFHLGALHEQEGLFGENVRRTKLGGASSFTGRRGGPMRHPNTQAQIVERNMKEAVGYSVEFFAQNHIRRILVGGTTENVSLFRSHLPKNWQSLIMGEFSMELTASHADVLSKAMQSGREFELRAEQRLVDDLVTGAAKNRGAVTGLADTLEAVNQNRVLTLVVSEGFQTSGYFCTGCKTLSAVRECRSCGGKSEPVTDVVELAVSTVLRQGGEVEVVYQSPDLEKKGHIGGFVRY